MNDLPQGIAELPIVGILRGAALDQVSSIVNAVRAGGLKSLEITMNSTQAGEQIRSARAAAGSELMVGAGTVTNMGELDAALEAGAEFIVTPVLVRPVVMRCVELGVPVFPGALSPTEIVEAWEMGAAMVKVFPADGLGPAYLRSLKGPFPEIRLMPTGGVDLESLEAFWKAGASGFGVGSPLFQADRIRAGDWGWLKTRCRLFAERYARLNRWRWETSKSG